MPRAGGDLAATVQAARRELDGVLAPSAVGAYASFVEAPADARSFYDAVTWARLESIKSLYDPADVFRGNHHIAPNAHG